MEERGFMGKALYYGAVAVIGVWMLVLVTCSSVVKPNQTLIVTRGSGAEKDRIEIVRGGRVWERPGDKFYWFEEGMQTYHFAENQTFESKGNEHLQLSSASGPVAFDVMIQLKLQAEQDPNVLREKLVKLMRTYNLLNYSGQRNLLAKLVGTQFRPSIKNLIAQECSNREMAKIFEEKDKINAKLFSSLKETFEPFGIEILAAGITCGITMPPAQQEKMNRLVTSAFELQALDKTEKEVMPKNIEIAEQRVNGEIEVQKISAAAVADAIRIEAVVEANRRQKFKDLLGDGNAIAFESMRTLVSALETGRTHVSVVPNNAQIWIGSHDDHDPVHPVAGKK